MKLALCFFVLFSFQYSWAQEDIEASRIALSKSKSKSDISISFLNFQEDLISPTQTSFHTAAQLYGFSLSYNKRAFRSHWAYSFGAGFNQGYAVAGTKGSSTYYEKRVPWTAFHAQVGGYRRLSAFFEMGPLFMFQYKTVSWPASGTTEVQSPPNPSTGIFLEFRQRLGTKYDLFQNMGILGESRSAAWNMGFSFNL